MMTRLRKSLAGPGYVILNVIRVLNIITFMDLVAACAVLLAKINMLNSFFFFEAVTHAVVALVSRKYHTSFHVCDISANVSSLHDHLGAASTPGLFRQPLADVRTRV